MDFRFRILFLQTSLVLQRKVLIAIDSFKAFVMAVLVLATQF